MKKKSDAINILISMSDNLDSKGFHLEANKVDFLIKKLAEELADDLVEEYSPGRFKDFNKSASVNNKNKSIVNNAAKALRKKRLK
jgi:hypothetical protein